MWSSADHSSAGHQEGKLTVAVTHTRTTLISHFFSCRLFSHETSPLPCLFTHLFLFLFIFFYFPSQVWDYVKANNLQNPENKREIMCDAQIEAVFGQKKVGLTEVMKLVAPHIQKT